MKFINNIIIKFAKSNEIAKQKKMHKQVQNVLEEYEKYRKKLELKIPSEYIKTFQTNSLFMPPL